MVNVSETFGDWSTPDCLGEEEKFFVDYGFVGGLIPFCRRFEPASVVRPNLAKFTEFTETTTVDDHDCISRHRLMPISSTFYNITLIIDDNWIPAPS